MAHRATLNEVGATQPNRTHTSQGAKSVQWLGASAAPAELATFLRARGLSLVTTSEDAAMERARVAVVQPRLATVARAPSLSSRRVAILLPDPGAADSLAQALRAKGAQVAALSLDPEALSRFESLDPDVVLIEAADFYGSCWEMVRALWQHARLRYATVLLFSPTPSAPDGSTALDVPTLCDAIDTASAAYERLRAQASQKDELDFSLDVLGPARSLRALLETKRSLRARFSCDDLTVEVDMVDDIIVGAQGGPPSQGTETFLGPHALAELMQRHEGRVRVRAVDHPSVTNIMAPLETALYVARETLVPTRGSGVRFRAVSLPGTPSGVAAPTRQATPSQSVAPATEPDTNESAPPSKTPRAHRSTLARGAIRPPPTLSPSLAPKADQEPTHSAKGKTRLGMPSPSVSTPPPVPAPRPSRATLPDTSVDRVDPGTVTALPSPAPKLSATKPAEHASTRARLEPLIEMQGAPRSASPTGSVPITELTAPEEAPVASARVAARIDSVVTKRKGPSLASMRVGLPEPNVVARDAGQVVAVASLPPPASPDAQAATKAPSSEAVPSVSPRPASIAPTQPLVVAIETQAYSPQDATEPALNSERLTPSFGNARGKLLLAVAAALALLWMGAAALGLPGSAEPRTGPSKVPTGSAPSASEARRVDPALGTKESHVSAALPLAPAQHETQTDDETSRKARAKRASLLVGHGHSFRKNGQLASAKQRYLEALREYPGYPRAVAGLAQIALLSGDATQAVSYARQLVKTRPAQLEYQVILGDAYKSAGLTSEAQKTFRTAAKRGSRTAQSRLEP